MANSKISRLKFNIDPLVQEMLSHIPIEKLIHGTILDPSIGGGQFVRAVEMLKRAHGKTDQEIRETVFGIGDNEFQINYAKSINRKLNRIALVGSYTIGDFLEMDFEDMKFDVVLANPPYLDGMHMKFLDLAYEIADTVAFIHPSSPFVSLKPTQTKKHDKTIKKIEKHIVSLDFKNGNKIFNIGLFVPVSVTLIDKNFDNGGIINVTTIDGKSHAFNGIKDVNVFGNIPAIYSLKEKFETLPNILEMRTDGEFLVAFTNIRGHASTDIAKMFADDFWTIVSDMKTISKKGDDQLDYFFKYYFETENEATNFLAYLRASFARGLLSLYKTGVNLGNNELAIIPIVDFTRSWTDAELYKHFNLTQDEITFIESNIK
jgi:predicted RNA methylase